MSHSTTTPAGHEAAEEHSAQDEPVQGESPHTNDERPQTTVPVSEAKKYRKRAQQAEQRLAELEQTLEAESNRAAELEQTVAHLERRQQVDDLLTEAGTIDLESARLLTEVALSEMEEPDVDAAVRDLRRRKPYLFRSARGSTRRAAAPRAEMSPAEASAEHAAAEAHATGRRSDLLRYLRLRRNRGGG